MTGAETRTGAARSGFGSPVDEAVAPELGR